MSFILRTRKLIARLRRQGARRSLSYVLLTVLAERWGVEVHAAYRLDVIDGPPATPPRSFALVSSVGELSDEDRRALEEYGGADLLGAFERAFAAGSVAAVARMSGSLACLCWIRRVVAWAPATNGPAALLMSCFTLPTYRGLGLYAETLRYGAISVNDRPVFVECSVFNHSSLRGIHKAGGRRIGTTWRVGRRAWFTRRGANE